MISCSFVNTSEVSVNGWRTFKFVSLERTKCVRNSIIIELKSYNQDPSLVHKFSCHCLIQVPKALYVLHSHCTLKLLSAFLIVIFMNNNNNNTNNFFTISLFCNNFDSSLFSSCCHRGLQLSQVPPLFCTPDVSLSSNASCWYIVSFSCLFASMFCCCGHVMSHIQIFLSSFRSRIRSGLLYVVVFHKLSSMSQISFAFSFSSTVPCSYRSLYHISAYNMQPVILSLWRSSSLFMYSLSTPACRPM